MKAIVKEILQNSLQNITISGIVCADLKVTDENYHRRKVK